MAVLQPVISTVSSHSPSLLQYRDANPVGAKYYNFEEDLHMKNYMLLMVCVRT